MQIQNDLREVWVQQKNILAGQQSFQQSLQLFAGSTATPLFGAVTFACVMLLDATGREHPIPLNLCTSFQQLNMVLAALLQPDSIECRVQRRYMEAGQYDLCIDKGMQTIQLASWPHVEAGTKIVMRIVFEEFMAPSTAEYRCRFCKHANHRPIDGSRKQDSLIDCQRCNRRFQISLNSGPPKAPESINRQAAPPSTADNYEHDEEIIRNFRVQILEYTIPQQITGAFRIPEEQFHCLWYQEGNTSCDFTGSLDAMQHHLIVLHLSGPPDTPTKCRWDRCNFSMRRDCVWRHVKEKHLWIRSRKVLRL